MLIMKLVFRHKRECCEVRTAGHSIRVYAYGILILLI